MAHDCNVMQSAIPARQGLSHADAGRIGALRRMATEPDLRAVTQRARDARWAKYLDQIPAEITDPAERMRRAGMLRRADMIALSAKAAQARRLKAEMAALTEALDATGLENSGRDA